MNDRKITCLFVVDPAGSGNAVGILHIHDCLRAGIGSRADRRTTLFAVRATGLKILLPLAALALLSTLFLFARLSRPRPDIPLPRSKRLPANPASRSRVSPAYRRGWFGVSVSAETIRPLADLPDTMSFSQMRVGSRRRTGTVCALSRPQRRNGRAREDRALDRTARLSTSSGYEMETHGMEADLPDRRRSGRWGRSRCAHPMAR
jgi:hypothetical protein